MEKGKFNSNSPNCEQWESLLADALDGLLKPEDEAAFAAHRLVCPACTEEFEAARRGREWLVFLAPEPELPAGLLDKILAQTGPGQMAGFGVAATGDGGVLPMLPQMAKRRDAMPAIPAWQRPGFMGSVRRFAEPRLLMTAAMALFSITLTLNMTGVRLGDVRISNLRSIPSVARSFMERRLTMASTPIIRYYDNSRFIYQVQSTVRELGRAAQSGGNSRRLRDTAPGESRQAPESPQVNRPEQSDIELRSEFLESSLRFQDRSAQFGGSSMEMQERGTEWTA
jgi:hypothetical protein